MKCDRRERSDEKERDKTKWKKRQRETVKVLESKTEKKMKENK